jgi:thiamine phosphate synthase YjbQ (UPF0047 family)
MPTVMKRCGASTARTLGPHRDQVWVSVSNAQGTCQGIYLFEHRERGHTRRVVGHLGE